MALDVFSTEEMSDHFQLTAEQVSGLLRAGFSQHHRFGGRLRIREGYAHIRML